MKNMHFMNARKFPGLFRQRGASLLEGIAYLGIAALIILGAISLLTTAFSSAQTNSVESQVVSIRTATRKLYQAQTAGYGAAAADLTAILANSNAFPPSMINGANVVNAWNGAVTVVVDATVTQFVITYPNVPKQVCIDLYANGGTANGWLGVRVGSSGAFVAAPTPATANAACTGATNTVAWQSA